MDTIQERLRRMRAGEPAGTTASPRGSGQSESVEEWRTDQAEAQTVTDRLARMRQAASSAPGSAPGGETPAEAESGSSYRGPAWAQRAADRYKPGENAPVSPTAQWQREKQKEYREKYPDADWGKLLGGAGLVGLDEIAKGGSSLLSAAEGLVTKPLGWALGNPELYKNGLFYTLNQGVDREMEANRERLAQAAGKAGTAGELVGKFGPATVAALPQAALAFLTQGASLAAQQSAAGLQAASAAAQTAGKGAAIAQTVTQAIRDMGKNPSFQYSLLNTIGGEYEQAKADGADDLHAYAYAAVAGLLNSAVEVGGGIDTLPDGGKSGLREWVDTMIDEGKEEVIQGAISQLAQAVIYGKENPIFSTTDQEAVIHPGRAAEEFAGGAVVGGVLGGGQIAVNQALSGLSMAGDAQIPAEPDRGAQPRETAQEAEKNAASTGEAAGGMAVKADTSLFEKGMLHNFNQARQHLIEFAKMHFPQTVTNRETGKQIGISRRGLDKFLSGNIPYEKYASGFHIPELIENAHRVGEASNYHPETAGSIPTFEYYDSDIEIDGKPYNAHIRVKNTNVGNKYYGHTVSEIDDIKIEPPTRTSYPENQTAQPENTGGSEAEPFVQTSTRKPQAGQPAESGSFASVNRVSQEAGEVNNGKTPSAAVQSNGEVNAETARRYIDRLARMGVNPGKAEQLGMWIAEAENGRELTYAQEAMIAGEPAAAGLLEFVQMRKEAQAQEADRAEEKGGRDEGTSGGENTRKGEMHYDEREPDTISGRQENGGLGQDSREQTESVWGRPAGQTGIQEQSVQARRRADVVAAAYDRAGAGGISTRSLMGVETGSDAPTLRQVPESIIRQDPELNRIYQDITEMGKTPVLYTGAAMVGEDARMVSGLVKDGKVFIRVDHTVIPAEKVWRHEKYHLLAAENPELVRSTAERILSSRSEAELIGLMETYIEQYGGVYGEVNVQGFTSWEDGDMLLVLEELLADAYAEKDTYHTGVERYAETVRKAANKQPGGLQGEDENATINTREKTLKEDPENGGARKEGREAFLQRASGAGYSVFEGDAAAYGYRRAGYLDGYEGPAQQVQKGEDENATINTREKTLKEDPENGGARKEEREAFLQRASGAGYSVFEGDTAAYGYRAVAGVPSSIAQQVQKEIGDLGVDCVIMDGGLEWNRDGLTGNRMVRHAVTIEGKRILIQNGTTISPRNAAGHEAFHFWKQSPSRQAYVDALEDNILYTSPDFLHYQKAVAEEYFGEDIDLTDRSKLNKLTEELYAAISGDIHEGVNDDYLRPMFRDYEAVKRAWNELARERSPVGEAGKRPDARYSVTESVDKSPRKKLAGELERLFPAGKNGKRSMKALIQNVMDGNGEGLSYPERMDRAFEALWESARIPDENTEAVEIARELRGRRVYASDALKAEFGDDWGGFRKQAFGAGIYLTNDRADVGPDVLNDELSGRYGGWFNAGETDAKAMLENMVRAVDAARAGIGEITLDEEARRQSGEIALSEEARRLGGEGTVEAFRTAYRSLFEAAFEEYHTELLERYSESEKAQRIRQLEQQRAKLEEYLSTARRTLRERAVSMEDALPARALKDAEGAPRSIDEYLAQKQAQADQARAKRLRHVPKSEFEGTENLRKLGVRIDGSVTDYQDAAAMRQNEAALRGIQREIQRAEKRMSPSAKEKKLASDLVTGAVSENDIRRLGGVDAGKIFQLADYYMAERAMGTGMIRQKKKDINRVLEERMAALFRDSDQYKVSTAAVLNHRTPQRNMLHIFGDQQGKIINEQIFDPVSTNEAERIRWTNKQLDQVRTFAGRDGKTSKLTKAERVAVQWTIEGTAVEQMLAEMEAGKGAGRAGLIRRAAEIMHETPDSLQDFAGDLGLWASERDLAKRYAGWLDEKERMNSGRVDQVKVQNAAKKFSQLFDGYYEAINDFLVSHGYEPIGFIKGYAPHLQPEGTLNLLDKALRGLGVNTDVTTLPTSIAGLTADYKPGKKWNPYFLTRQTDTAQADITAGFESYVQYLGDVLYHTDDIMRVRKMSEHIRKTYAPEEIRIAIEQAEDVRWRPQEEKQALLWEKGKLRRGETVSPEQMNQILEDYISEQFKAIDEKKKYSDLVPWLDNYANILAGKQSLADRGSEYGMGRRIMNVGNRLTRIFARSQVAGNLSSALNQTSQLPQIISENGAVNTAQAVSDFVTGKLRKAGFSQESDLLTGKEGIHFIVHSPGDMVMNVLFTPAGFADGLVSTLAVRSAYLKAVKAGKNHQEAMRLADAYATGIMGSRAKGSRPLAFESKNPVSQMAHIFQLEVLNSWEHLSQDLPREFREIQRTEGKNKAVAALVGVIIKTLLAAFLLNRISEEAYGGTPAQFDLLGISANFIASGEGLSTNQWLAAAIDNGLEKLTGKRLFHTEPGDDAKPFDWGAGAKEAWGNISNDIPFVRNVSGMLGWGDQTLPWPDIYGGVTGVRQAISADGLFSGRTAEELFSLATQLLPGGRQLNKTVSGAGTMARGGRIYGWGDKARLQYPVESTPLNWGRALLFGNSGLPESRAYWAAGGEKGLSAEQTTLWEELTGTGAGRTEAYEAIKEVAEADGWREKLREIAEAPWNSDMKDQLLENSLSEKAYERWRAADKAGVQLMAYADFMEGAYRRAQKRTGKENANPGQEDVAAALEASRLTGKQKTAIWNSYGWKKESPWG